MEGERVVRRAKAEQCHKEWVEKKVEKERQRRDKEARQKLQEVAENEKVLLVKSFLNVYISSKTEREEEVYLKAEQCFVKWKKEKILQKKKKKSKNEEIEQSKVLYPMNLL